MLVESALLYGAGIALLGAIVVVYLLAFWTGRSFPHVDATDVDVSLGPAHYKGNGIIPLWIVLACILIVTGSAKSANTYAGGMRIDTEPPTAISPAPMNVPVHGKVSVVDPDGKKSIPGTTLGFVPATHVVPVGDNGDYSWHLPPGTYTVVAVFADAPRRGWMGNAQITSEQSVYDPEIPLR
jgi:hypothetical protein